MALSSMLKEPISVNSNIIIRNAVETDCDDIMRLIGELAEFEKYPEGVIINSETLKQDGFGERPLFSCLVAEDQTCSPMKIVGMALMFNIYSTWTGKCLHLEDLYVQLDYRRRGIGKGLFFATYQIAIDTNCARLNFNVLDWNQTAIDFYKARGAIDLTVAEGWHAFRINRDEIQAQLSKLKTKN